MYKTVFGKLLRTYGPQGWWPVSGKKGKPTYRTRTRLTAQQRLEVIIGAILTQNTSWKNVEKAMLVLHQHGLIDTQKLLAVPQQRLAKLIRSSGYHNQKAKKLKHVAAFLLRHPMLDKLPVEELRQTLLNVHGIGPETADSIILYAFQKPSFVIDTYTKRIFARLGRCSENIAYEKLRAEFMQHLPADARQYNEYHALLVKHAKQHCRKIPLCTGCPIRDRCMVGQA